MDIVKTRYCEIEILKTWLPDKDSSYFWCGPGLRFPFTHASFLEDIHWEKMPSYSLLNNTGELVGFGQCYEKNGRCHLARLIISPDLRGKGHGQWFIANLMSIGAKELDTDEFSLFVVNYNQSALRCYEALGFKREEYPPDHKLFDNINFMVGRRLT